MLLSPTVSEVSQASSAAWSVSDHWNKDSWRHQLIWLIAFYRWTEDGLSEEELCVFKTIAWLAGDHMRWSKSHSFTPPRIASENIQLKLNKSAFALNKQLNVFHFSFLNLVRALSDGLRPLPGQPGILWQCYISSVQLQVAIQSGSMVTTNKAKMIGPIWVGFILIH